MFWKFDLHTTSHVDQLLDKEDVTLRELMEEDDVLQECKAQNRRLLLFLSQDHCMQELVNLITTEPPADLEERSRFKFPNIACELLTSDVSIINDKLGGDESLLETLYKFLDNEPPLNPLLASFFSKTIGNLIARKTEQVITFLKKKEGFIGLVLKHIDASAMMDLLLRLISCVEPAPLRQEVLHWLNEEKLVQRLIELIHTGNDEERQSNASQTLCDIIRLSRDQANQMPDNVECDPLLTVLESQEIVTGLLKNMFEGEKSEASIVNGTQVLLTLLETRRSGLEGLMELYSQGYERSHTVNSSILNAIEPHLKDFQQLLLDPPKKSAILMTVGILEQPLGNARLHVARLVAALLQTSAPSICQELCNLATMDLLLDLFFKYTWNNFLHLQVELCVAAILNHPSSEERPGLDLQNHDGNPSASSAEGEVEQKDTSDPENSVHNPLVTHLFQKCQLVQRILNAWEENDQIQAEGGTRRGNMGHLTRIANMVVQNLEKGPVQAQITDLIKELPEDCRGRWESFVDETLRETNRRNTVELVSTHNIHSSSEDDDFPNDMSLQQTFSDYQIQQMTANFADQFGFHDEEFSEHDENINSAFDRITEINFSLDADDNGANAAAFEACCNERIRQFDDAEEEEEDIWEEKEINYATQAKSRTRFGVSQTSEGGSRGSIENGGQEQGCELQSDEEEDTKQSTSDTGPGWTANFRDSGGTGLSQVPTGWESSGRGEAQTQVTGWANFIEFQPFTGTETGPRCSSPVDSGDTLKQAKQNHEQEDFGASGPSLPGDTQTTPVVASDSSSLGVFKSESADKNANVPPDVVSSEMAPTNQTADLISEEYPVSLDKLSLSDPLPPSQQPAADSSVNTQTNEKEDSPQTQEVSVNGPM
ncbi:serine/threonine-protein phosphatase 6 regulatory subunit 2a [Poecilia reticulata]|uniref:Protein phosphatase 6, regulatory subunit 2a n=1 Tax=Poecilia reticulata TaxID=8081 RepID=A0A3P9PBH5_POERE|nr:PREDICTED: serine/threonine-protein phosphatase 6 regulatory subunit 2-like [Poecilia reticulata]XP_008399415.1 PREDICTED: serine/threonine-protein phosphatase 6 regulatory subunit 2-like [Poecilia reticulata]